jgi:L-lactate permease
MTGWRNTLEVWLPLAVIGGTFAAVQFLWSKLVGFELVDIVAAVCSMTAGVIVIRLWKPGRIWRFGHEAEVTPVAVDVPLPPPPNFGEGAPGFSTPHIVCGPGRNRRL